MTDDPRRGTVTVSTYYDEPGASSRAGGAGADGLIRLSCPSCGSTDPKRLRFPCDARGREPFDPWHDAFHDRKDTSDE